MLTIPVYQSEVQVQKLSLNKKEKGTLVTFHLNLRLAIPEFQFII
jgi:hypothetical protein